MVNCTQTSCCPILARYPPQPLAAPQVSDYPLSTADRAALINDNTTKAAIGDVLQVSPRGSPCACFVMQIIFWRHSLSHVSFRGLGNECSRHLHQGCRLKGC